MYCTIIIIAALHHNASIKALSGVTRFQNLHHPIIYSSWTTPTHHASLTSYHSISLCVQEEKCLPVLCVGERGHLSCFLKLDECPSHSIPSARGGGRARHPQKY